MEKILLTPAGLVRRLKRHLLKEEHSFFAICTPGFESILANELKQIPLANITSQTSGGIEFSGPLDLVYAANLHLRTANRVLLRITSFTARSYPELFNKCRKIDWELYLGFNSDIQFTVSAKNSRLHQHKNIATAIFDAVNDRMSTLSLSCEISDTSPINIHVRYQDDVCHLSIDTSGDHLYKRGYREATALAPLRESTAAALLTAASFERYNAILDPFCGSGTFCIEAALMASQNPPGAYRQFAFEAFASHKPTYWQRIKTEALNHIRPQDIPKILGIDHSATAIKAALENSIRAKVNDLVSFDVADARNIDESTMPEQGGLIIANPPWGKRVGTNTFIEKLLHDFGSRLKQNFKGWDYGILLPDTGIIECLGLKPTRSICFINGGIEVRFILGRI